MVYSAGTKNRRTIGHMLSGVQLAGCLSAQTSGFSGTGNNPMVGTIIAVILAVAEA